MGTLSETSAFVFVALLLCAPGCGAPLQQRIAPYPGYGQQFPQLQRDSSECEAWARSVAGSGADSAAGGAAGGALAGAAGGAALGTIAGAFLGDAGSGAAIGAALGGTSGGLEGAAGGAAAFDQRLLAAYQNCMAARGYVVNGSTIQPAAPPAVHQSAAPAERPTVETRLTRLRELHQDGLISNKEYRERRQKILDDL